MLVGEVVDGDCVLARRREMGRRFPLGCLAETASQFGASERDALSARWLMRKLCPSLESQNGTQFPLADFSETATQNIASE